MVTKYLVTGEVGKYSYCFNLDFFVLSGKDVKFNTFKYPDAYIVAKDLLCRHVIKENVCDARNGVKNKFFVLVDCSFINCTN